MRVEAECPTWLRGNPADVDPHEARVRLTACAAVGSALAAVIDLPAAELDALHDRAIRQLARAWGEIPEPTDDEVYSAVVQAVVDQLRGVPSLAVLGPEGQP